MIERLAYKRGRNDEILNIELAEYKRMTIQERFTMYPMDYSKEEELDWGEDIGEETLCD